MSTGNFFHYDSKYIYVPKVFFEEADDIIFDELSYIHNEVERAIEKIKIPKGYDIYLSGYDKNIKYKIFDNNLFTFISIFEYDTDITNNIYFGFIPGYYQFGNFDYIIEYDKYSTKMLDKLTLKVCNTIEKILSLYCYKFVVSVVASSGETLYKRVK